MSLKRTNGLKRTELKRGTKRLARGKALLRKAPKGGRRGWNSTLPRESKKHAAQRSLRQRVDTEVRARDRGCVGPRRGLPGECRGREDVHEVVFRSRDSSSYLNPDRCVTLCRRHHNDVHLAVGEARERVKAAGLIVRADPVWMGVKGADHAGP